MIHGSWYVDANKWRKFIPLNAKSCQGCVTVSTRDMAYINKLVGKEKGNLLAARRYQHWKELFDAFVSENEERIDFSFWNALKLNENGDFPYQESLFSYLPA